MENKKRLVYAEDVEREIWDTDCDVFEFCEGCVTKMGISRVALDYAIDRVPIADAREVIHARWETECRNRKRCSNCSLRINTDTQIEGNFCPICGAMMDGGNEDV